jgi:hypothetical protein
VSLFYISIKNLKIIRFAIKRKQPKGAGAPLEKDDEGIRQRKKGANAHGISDYTLLYLHANAGNMGHRLPIANVLYNKLECNIFMLSYRVCT